MREISFRGQARDGKWVYGSLVHRTVFYGDPCDDYVILSDGEFDFDYYEDHEVIKETVGQFTGITDKNGKKIFEGDRVRYYDACGKEKGIGVVNWSELFSAWHIDEYSTLYGGVIAKYEVLGNIHDNPELLEERL